MKSRLITIIVSVIISVLTCSLAFVVYQHYFLDQSTSYHISDEETNKIEYRIDKLRVMLYDLRNPSLGFTSATYNFVIQVSNQMKYKIESPKLVYNAYINGVHVAVGKTFLPDIPANNNRKYNASFIVSYIDFGKSIINAIKSGNFTLRLKGKVISRGLEKPFDIVYNY